jgi:hypothetical protein
MLTRTAWVQTRRLVVAFYDSPAAFGLAGKDSLELTVHWRPPFLWLLPSKRLCPEMGFSRTKPGS